MRLFKKILSALILMLFAQLTMAQEVIIEGKAQSYSGDEIIFYTYSDYITSTEMEVGRCTVASNGQFSCSLKILETSMVFSHLGIYKIYFFAERGKHYQVLLPPKEAKTEAQRLNPFFREVDLQVGITNIDKTDLNYLINAFDLRFNENFDLIVENAYRGIKTMNIDSLITRIESRFTGATNQYFNDYREYRYGLLKQITLMQKSKSLSDQYFLNKPIRYNNPAYMELFNAVYDKYFIFYSRINEGKSIYKDISVDKSLKKLKKTLGKNDVLANDTLKEIVILKGLFDEFFNDEFSRSALLSILDQLYRTAITEEHIIIAENIRSRITRLLPGFVPSPFALADTSGAEISMDKFKGKYIYLNFCTTGSYTCLQEFPMLQKLYNSHKRYLEVVTILTDNDKHDIAPFLKNTGYNWTFLHYGNKPSIIKDYDVRAYPTYYLVGPDQKLVMSPAPSPSEDFEAKFIKMLKQL